MTLVLCLLAALGTVQPVPDLSGTWRFDRTKSMAPGPDGRIVLAPMLGDEVVVLQTKSSITFRISVQGQTVVAVYDLTGKERENTSPGDITVRSRAAWKEGKLVIESTSEAEEGGKPITVRTTRLIWLDPAGDLIVERSGTPSTQVTPSRSVYHRLRSPAAIGPPPARRTPHAEPRTPSTAAR